VNVDRLQGCRLSVSVPLCLFTADRRRRASWRRLCLICRRVRTLSTAPETVTRLWPVERCRLPRHLLKRSQTVISEASSTLTTCTQSTDHVSRYVYTAGVLRTLQIFWHNRHSVGGSNSCGKCHYTSIQIRMSRIVVRQCGDAFPIERVLVATYLLSVEALPHCRCGVANKSYMV